MATMRGGLLLFMSLVAGQAFADDQPISQRRIATERIAGPVGGVGLYEVSPGGAVAIDWRAVEAMATATHRGEQPIAAMMLAIRDGRWTSMPRQ